MTKHDHLMAMFNRVKLTAIRDQLEYQGAARTVRAARADCRCSGKAISAKIRASLPVRLGELSADSRELPIPEKQEQEQDDQENAANTDTAAISIPAVPKTAAAK